MNTTSSIQINIHEKLPPDFGADDEVAIDLEIFGMEKGKFHRPVGTFASCALTNDGTNVYVITKQDDMLALERIVKNAVPIFHNASFDIFHMRRWMYFDDNPTMWDTMVMERELWSGYYSDFALKDLVRRYLEIYMQKETRKEYEKATELTEEMIIYNAYDAALTWRVQQIQKMLAKKTHRHVYFNIDQPALYAFLRTKGSRIDVPKWMSAYEDFSGQANAMKKSFPFNPNSPVQVKKYFNEVLEIPVESTGVEILERIHHPIAAEVLKYRVLAKRASTYGKNWLENHLEEDCRVYTHYDVNRAESGRTSSGDPNLQNIPARDVPIYRESFIAAPGNVLVGGDFGQQEIRVAAFLSQDDDLIALLKSGRDIYASVASKIHHRDIQKADKERQDAKAVVLGAIYGLTAKGLHTKLSNEWEERKKKAEQDTISFDEPSITLEECEELLNSLFDEFPKLRIWCEIQRTKAYDPGYVRTPSKRKCWINPYHYSAENNALNSPCQGGGADMIKVAVRELYARWDRFVEPFPLTLQVHDELVLEVREENKEYAVKMLSEVMYAAAEEIIPGIPAKIDVKIGHNWSEIH